MFHIFFEKNNLRQGSSPGRGHGLGVEGERASTGGWAAAALKPGNDPDNTGRLIEFEACEGEL